LKVAIVGCGAMGRKRAQHLAGAQLAVCIDIDSERAARLATFCGGCDHGSDWRTLLARRDLDAVIVSTPQDLQAEIARAAVASGLHVLVEKPGACRAQELEELARLAIERQVRVRVGFNHRYHPAFLEARRLVDVGELGPLFYVRARYGHGGRLGYASEWRAQPEHSGGGELIDQGVHLIDLARWFLGEFTEVSGFAHTYFWNMAVEDNGFLLLRTPSDRVAFLHASWTEWKNTFSFELFGRDGKLEINGLGGSYGTERLTWYRMLPAMGPPETTVFEYPETDRSFTVEMAEFIEDVERGREPRPGLGDARAALTVVERVYGDARPHGRARVPGDAHA
jgi:predicted dehydrogenase